MYRLAAMGCAGLRLLGGVQLSSLLVLHLGPEQRGQPRAEDAEEVVQGAFWSVIGKIETFRGDSAFGTWLYRVVANAAYQRYRKRRRRAHQTELRMLLGAAIEELPAAYRAVIVLREVDGLSYQQIAEALGLRITNVKARVHRARLFLRKRLDAHFSMAGVASLAGIA